MKKFLMAALVAELVMAKDNTNGAPGVPEWVVLFRAGMNELEGHAPYLVDAQAFDLVQAEFVRRGNDLVFDYEHQTLKDVEAPAAGWVKELSWDPAQGIMARVEWTERGAAYVAAREYRYFSPVFFVRKADSRLFGLHSVALTNNPRHNHLQPILSKLGAHPAQPQPKEGSMDFLKKLAAKLGLSETATEDEVFAAVAKLQDVTGVPQVVLAALGLDQADASTVVASIHALRQQGMGAVSVEDFEALKTMLAKRDADEAVAAALAIGKITPDQKDWAVDYAKTDLPGFRTFVAKAPVVVPVGKLPSGETVDDKAQASAVTLQIAAMMDLTQDDLKKYGGVS